MKIWETRSPASQKSNGRYDDKIRKPYMNLDVSPAQVFGSCLKTLASSPFEASQPSSAETISEEQ